MDAHRSHFLASGYMYTASLVLRSETVTHIKLTGFRANQAASEPCKTHKKQRQTKGSSVDTESILP